MIDTITVTYGLMQGDDQYLSIFAQCGALVVDLTSFPANATVPELSAEVQRQRDVKGSSELSTCSIFFEESKSPSAKVKLYEWQTFGCRETGVSCVRFTISSRILEIHGSECTHTNLCLHCSLLVHAFAYVVADNFVQS